MVDKSDCVGYNVRVGSVSESLSWRFAEVAELADAHGSGPCGSNTLWVRLPSSALQKMSHRTKLCGGSSFSYLSMPVSIFHHTIPRIFPISRIIPKIQLVNTPNKMTGPAMVKILHPIPNTCPSEWVNIRPKKIHTNLKNIENPLNFFW